MRKYMSVRLPAGARRIKDILDDASKMPEEKLSEIEQVVNRKLRFKVRSFSLVQDKFRLDSIRISQQFYQKIKAILNRISMQ